MAEPIKNALKFASVVFLIATGLGALGIGSFATASGAIAWGTIQATAAYAFVGTAAAGIIGMMNTKGVEATSENLGAKVTTRDPLKFRQIIYGKTKVAGVITHIETSGVDNHKLNFVMVLSGHEIHSVESVFFNDTKLTSSTSTINGETVHTITNSQYTNTENEQSFASGRLGRFTIETGSQTTANGFANAQMSSITNNSKFLGCSYIMFQLIYDAEKFGGGIPNVTAVVKGKKIYDPRENSHDASDPTTWEWSDNPALIFRDYLQDTNYGLRATTSEINDTTNAGGIQAAANICDQDVLLADNTTTEKRYTANGFTNFGASGEGVLSGILSSMAGKMSYTNGQFNLFAGTTQTASLTITDAECLSTMQIATNPNNGDLYNAVKAIYTDSTGEKYVGTDSAIYKDTTFLNADTPTGESTANFLKMQEVQLPFTVTDSMAQRISRISLKHQRQTTTVQVVTTINYMKLQPNDYVMVTNERLGFTNKVFEVIAMQLELITDKEGGAVIGTGLTLKEIENAVFTFAVSDYVSNISDGTDVGGGDLSVSTPTGLGLATRAEIDGATTKVDILASWTNIASPKINGTEVAYKLSTDSDYTGDITVGKGVSNALIPNVVIGKTYNVKVRHFDLNGIYSAYSSAVNITVSDPTSVAVPTNWTVTGHPLGISLAWTNPPNTNLRAIKLYRHTSSFTPTDDTYLIGTLMGEPSKQMFTTQGSADGLTAGTTYYFALRAILHTDVHSNFTSVLNASFTQDKESVGLTNLADLDSSQNTKLTNIEDNATLGAKLGTNLKDSSNNQLGDEDVRNSDLSVDFTGNTTFRIKKGSTVIDTQAFGKTNVGLDTLADLDSSQNTKLTNIEANATVGAQAGTNLKDSGGSSLGDEDVRNSDLVITKSGQNVQIKKGTTLIDSVGLDKGTVGLSDLDSLESGTGTKLSGIEANATVGAKAGTNLKDSSNNSLGDDDVKNDSLDIDTNGTSVRIKKGSTVINSTTLDKGSVGLSNLASLDSAQDTKLQGIEANATVGAKLDDNLVDENNNDLASSDIVTNQGTSNDTNNVNSVAKADITGSITGTQTNVASIVQNLAAGNQSINAGSLDAGTINTSLIKLDELFLPTTGTGSSGSAATFNSTMTQVSLGDIGTGAGFYMGTVNIEIVDPQNDDIRGASLHIDIKAGFSTVYTKYWPIGIKEGNQYYDAGDQFGDNNDLDVMHLEFAYLHTGSSTLTLFVNGDSNDTQTTTLVKATVVKFGAETVSFNTSSFTASKTNQTAGANVDSGTVTVSGFTGSKQVNLSGNSTAKVSVNGGTFANAASVGTITSGQTFEIRLTASSTAGTTRSATVEIGGTSVTYQVTTAGTYTPTYSGGGGSGSAGGGFENTNQLV